MNFEHHKLFLSLSLEVLAVVPFRHYSGKSNNANVPISGRPTTAVASNGGRSIWRNRWSHCSFFTNKTVSQESVLPCLGTSVALSPCKITVSRAGVSATLSGHQRSTESVHAEPMWSHKWTNWTSRENLWRNEDNETPVDSDGPPNWYLDQHRSFAPPTVNQSYFVNQSWPIRSRVDKKLSNNSYNNRNPNRLKNYDNQNRNRKNRHQNVGGYSLQSKCGRTVGCRLLE